MAPFKNILPVGNADAVRAFIIDNQLRMFAQDEHGAETRVLWLDKNRKTRSCAACIRRYRRLEDLPRPAVACRGRFATTASAGRSSAARTISAMCCRL